MMNNNRSYKYKEEDNAPSTDTNTVITTSLDPNNPPKLTPAQKQHLQNLANLSDKIVRKEAESDPDCEPLD
jgi:hypothetical protein